MSDARNFESIHLYRDFSSAMVQVSCFSYSEEEEKVSQEGIKMSTSDQIKESLWVRILSGSVGSLLTAVVVTPLEVVKVRQQFGSPVSTVPGHGLVKLPPNVKPCPSCGVFVFNNGLRECLLPRSAVPYFDPLTGILKENLPVSRSNGTISMLRNIYKTEGAAGIYAGLTPTLVMGVPNTVLYFTSYEEMKEYLDGSLPATIIPPLAGASARLVASCATAPLELIKTRQAARIGGGSSASAGLISELRNTIRTEGVLSLYRGLSPTLMRDVPFSAVYWYFIEKFRACWGSHTVSASEQGMQALINGTFAGLLAAGVTTPLDVVKTRRQVSSSVEVFEPALCDHQGAVAYESKPSSPQSMGTVATLNKILTEEGITGLWRGNQARMIKVAPACALMLSSYEIGKRLLSESS